MPRFDRANMRICESIVDLKARKLNEGSRLLMQNNPSVLYVIVVIKNVYILRTAHVGSISRKDYLQ